MKSITDLLVGLFDGKVEAPELSEPIPTNAATKESHKKHKILIDKIWKEGKALEDRLKQVREMVNEEMVRWAKEMGEVQPELKDATYFEITDDSEFFKIPVDELPEGMLKAPDWVKGISKTMN
jgi:hypothetical protein